MPPGSPAETDWDENFVQSVPFEGNQTAPLAFKTKAGYTGDPPQIARRHPQAPMFQDVRVHVFAKHSASQWVEIATYDVPRSDPGAVGGAASGPCGLERRLGPLDAAAIVISNVIGGGIFFVPVIVAQLVPNPVAMLAVWLVGGALAFAGAMAYAELAAVRPHAGGEYVYLRDAYGPLAAFLTGWTSFVAGFSGAIAASAVALADYVTVSSRSAAANVKPVVVASARDRRADADPRARPRARARWCRTSSPASRSAASSC